MKPRDPADAERRIERLRGDITTDLAALRKAWGGPAQWTRHAAGDWTAQAARLRGIPAWAVGVVAGVVAGVWSALRRPRKVE